MNTCEIPLTRGYKTVVDKDLYRYLNKWKWHAHSSGTNVYAYRTGVRVEIKGKSKREYVYMHKEIMKYSGHDITGKVVTHKNSNTLDNRIENLAVCTVTESRRRRRQPSSNKSGYKGVSRCANKWRAAIKSHNTWKHLGLFEDIEEAALAYNEAAKKYHGEFARLNQL